MAEQRTAEEGTTPGSNGQLQQPPLEPDADSKRRHSDGGSDSDVHKAAAARKRQRIHDSDADDDVVELNQPPNATAPSPSSVTASQQRKELTFTDPNQLPSSTPRPSALSDSDGELDDDVPLILRPGTNNASRRSSTEKRSAAAAATPTPSTPSTSVKSPFATSTGGKRRLSKSTAKTPTTAPSPSTPAMSPSQSAKPSLAALPKPSSATASSASPPTATPTTPPGASPTNSAAGRSVSSHMTDRLVETIGGANAAQFAASVSHFIVSHGLSLRDTRDLYFRLLSNLRSNSELLARVRSDDITAEQLCTMSEADMAGDEVRRQREEAKKASIRDVTMAKEMMIAKQTKAGVEYIAVAGDKLTRTDMFDEKLTLTGTEGQEEGEQGEENGTNEAQAEPAISTEQSGGANGVMDNGVVGGEDEFLSFEEIERRQRESKDVDYESKYASDVEDEDVVEQSDPTPTNKRRSGTLDDDSEAMPAAARKKSKASPTFMDGANGHVVDVNAEVSSAGDVSLVISPKSTSQTVARIVSPVPDSRKQAHRAEAIELDMDQTPPLARPASSAAQPSSKVISPRAKPTAITLPFSPPPALSPGTPQSPPSVIPLPSLQPVANSAAASLFLGPLQSSSRWPGQVYFNGHDTTIAFNGRLVGAAGQSQSNTAVKALSVLPTPPSTIHIAGREPTSEAAKLLNECISSPRLMALLYVLQPQVADAAAMEQFCAFHADKQRVAIADMRKESGLFYRFGRMSAMGETMGRELPLDLFARCFSGVKGLRDARSYYCVVVYAEKRTSGAIGPAVVPRRQESSSSVSSVASTDSSRANSTRQRSSQAAVVTPPPPAQPVTSVYPSFPVPSAAAATAAVQPSTFTSPPFAPPAAIPAPLHSGAVAPPTANAPSPSAYAGYHHAPPVAGYYMPASQYPGYLPMVPEQLTATVPPQHYTAYPPPQLNQSAYPPPSQHYLPPHSQPQPQPQPAFHPPTAPSTGAGAMGGPPPPNDHTDWNQVKKFLESIKTMNTASPSAVTPSPPASLPSAMPPPSPPRAQQPSNARHSSPRQDEGGGGRYRDEDRARMGRAEDERDGGQQLDMRRRYELELQRLEEEKRRLDAMRRETDRLSRDSGRMLERERDGERDRSSEKDRRRDYDRGRDREWERERDRERDRPKEQPRVYDSSRERERERERAESIHRSRGGGAAADGQYESQRERIERELRETERERVRLAQLAAQRTPTSYSSPPPSSSSQQPPPKTVSGYIHPSRLAQAPR